jgi:hypothetical protein
LRDNEYIKKTVPLDLYTVYQRAKGDPRAAWFSAGTIEVGHSTPMDVLHNYFRYQPAPSPDDEEPDTDWVDISSSVKTIDDKEEGFLHYHKVIDPVLSPWGFDITIENPGQYGGRFTGTYTDRKGAEHDWKGRWSNTVEVEMDHEVAPEVPKPADLQGGSIASLMSLSPFAFKDDGVIKKGDDGAQVLGDRMWQKVGLHPHPHTHHSIDQGE